ncbi:MAG TPA: hypothetical protein VFV65_01885 [Gemmatimonadales bacterium]|nr:hypothetical protein [Gemmatimonadales bacterium]
MTWWRAGAALLVLAACSDLSSNDETVVAIQVTAPPGAVVEVGDTVQYTAIALNRNGDVIPAPIRWATPDTAVIAVDSLTGVVLGKVPGPGRVQATVQGLISPLNIVTVVATPDTLILVPPDSILVDTTAATTTPPLVARLEALAPAAPVVGWPIIYEVVEPLFADPADRTIEFGNSALADTATTGSNGEPVNPVVLARINGVTPPDSVIVEIRATRYKQSQPVPGSGQRWIIRFGP